MGEKINLVYSEKKQPLVVSAAVSVLNFNFLDPTYGYYTRKSLKCQSILLY